MKFVTIIARLLAPAMVFTFMLASAIAGPVDVADQADGTVSETGPNLLIGKPAPELRFKAYGTNQPVDLAELQGKMVVVDFFLAETTKDLSGFDDVTDVEHSYAKKGVVVLGVSLDENQASIVSLLQKKNIDWPFDYDPLGVSGPMAQRWHVAVQTAGNSWNYWRVAYVISPEGTVLWAGPTDGVSRAIDKEIKDHPPQLVDPKLLADARTALDLTQADIADKRLGDAYRERAKISDAARADDEFAAALQKTDDELKNASDAALSAADALLGEKKYAEAAKDLNDLMNSSQDTPLGMKVKAKLNELRKNPEARSALQTAEKNGKADDLLNVAQKLQSDKKDVQAYARFKAIIKIYAGTPAAQTAADAVAAYDADPGFTKKLANVTTTAPLSAAATTKETKVDPARARGLLSLANSYRDSGNPDKAREKYQEVISTFPATPQAEAAKKELEKLSQ